MENQLRRQSIPSSIYSVIYSLTVLHQHIIKKSTEKWKLIIADYSFSNVCRMLVDGCNFVCHPVLDQIIIVLPGYNTLLPWLQFTGLKMLRINIKNERKMRSLVIQYKNIVLILVVMWICSFTYFRSGPGAAVKTIDPNRVRKIINKAESSPCWY